MRSIERHFKTEFRVIEVQDSKDVYGGHAETEVEAMTIKGYKRAVGGRDRYVRGTNEALVEFKIHTHYVEGITSDHKLMDAYGIVYDIVFVDTTIQPYMMIEAKVVS